MKLKPNIKDLKMLNKKRISLEVSNTQLWYLYLGLSRLQLVDRLQKQIDKLSNAIQRIGEKEFEWV